MTDRDFEVTGERRAFDGHVFDLDVIEIRYADGTTASRDVIRHPGAVAIVAWDEEAVHLVRQPRPAIGDPDSLELPAGLLDVDGEPPLATAKRELTEEIGRAAAHWEFITRFHPSVGVSNEITHVFGATGLREEATDSGEDERIEVVRWPLTDLDGALAGSSDAKTIIGLTWLRARLQR